MANVAVDKLKEVLHFVLDHLPPLPSEQQYHDFREKINSLEEDVEHLIEGDPEDAADDSADDAADANV